MRRDGSAFIGKLASAMVWTIQNPGESLPCCNCLGKPSAAP